VNPFVLLSLSSVAWCADELPSPPDLDIAWRNRLTTQWGGVAVNMVAADVLSLYIPGTQQEVVDTLGSEEAVPWAMLGGAVLYQIPVWNMVGAQMLPPRAARWTTWTSAAVTTVAVVGLGSDEPHYIALAGAQVALMTGATITALRWHRGRTPRGLALHGQVTPTGASVVVAGRL
jgi:hypothetical protein